MITRCSSGSKSSATARSRRTISPTRACGSFAATRACTRSRPSCAGPDATASRASQPSSAEWGAHAARIARFIDERCWNAERKSFVSTADGSGLDASLLLLYELGFLAADDSRFVTTVDAIGAELKRGDFIFRYIERDDFGEPENAFLVCTFWYVNALAVIGRRTEARALFERLLACRTTHGLLAEHLDLKSGELWGNFPQTYSMVGLIASAIRLSLPWDEAF